MDAVALYVGWVAACVAVVAWLVLVGLGVIRLVVPRARRSWLSLPGGRGLSTCLFVMGVTLAHTKNPGILALVLFLSVSLVSFWHGFASERRAVRSPKASRQRRPAVASGPLPPEFELTPARLEAAEDARLDWRRSVVEERPANRDQVEAALREAYAVVGLRPPEVRWVESPAALLRRPLPREHAELVFRRTSSWMASALPTRCELDRYMRLEWLRDTSTGRLVDRTFGSPGAWHTLHPVWIEAGSGGPLLTRGARTAESIIPQVAKAQFIAESSSLDLGPWRPLVTLAREGCAYLLGTDVAYASERHIAISLDGDDRLHSETGPAIEWADGFSAHAWHGRWIARDLFERRQSIGLDEIVAETSWERRELLLELVGYDRLVEIGPSVVLDDDVCGKLWRVELPDMEAITLVEVVNATPDPDGGWRRFFLRVPPAMGTAREAVAWTFRLPETEWMVETES
jgi:hypothetical protein